MVPDMLRNAIRQALLSVPQNWIPECVESKFFDFNEIAARAHAESISGRGTWRSIRRMFRSK